MPDIDPGLDQFYYKFFLVLSKYVSNNQLKMKQNDKQSWWIACLDLISQH